MKRLHLMASSLAAALLLSSPAAHADGSSRKVGTTVHSAAQRTVQPLGNHLRVVKPIGYGRKPPKTILTKRPP